ncbi:MAG: ATP-binding protein [Anaerolineales bacterium]|nr:ATP-binding protein [Anaerolineales bacterium]
MQSFIGRKQEINALNSYWQRAEAALLIVYGRRRVGKTRLLTHWLAQESIPHALYWVAQPSAAVEQLRQFSQALYRFENPTGTPLETFSYQSWEQALEQVARLAEKQRFTLIIDEFTYLLTRTPELAGLFQNMWDHLLKQRNLLLVLCGSHLGMMKKHVLSYQAPLYGRAAAQLHVQPLPFGVTHNYFPQYDAAERVALYAMFGGIPAYWERLDQSLSISENIRQQLLTPNNLMQAEPRLLLQDFVREPDNYIAIFSAIANGYRTQKEMMAFTGLAQGHISSYLAVLESAGFIERRVPITAGPQSRQSRYHITDPYLRFYYRFLATRQSQLALGVQEPALAEIKRHLLDFIGTYTWEEICREWVLRAGAAGDIPYLVDQVGSYWDKKVQVDVVGINRMEKTLILGECKWSPKEMEANVLTTLVQKTKQIVPKQGTWRVFYVGMARGGWSSAAQQATEGVFNDRGSNWQGTNGLLVGLNRIDYDLINWSNLF